MTTRVQALQVAFMRGVVAREYHIPTKGIGPIPGMKHPGLLVDWERLAVMEITPELHDGFLALLASGEAIGRELGCDVEPLYTDEPAFQILLKKINDRPAVKKKEFRDHLYRQLDLHA